MGTGGSSSSGASASPGTGDTAAGTPDDELPPQALTIRNRGEIVNLDPHLGSGNPDAVIDNNIYSKLVITYPEARDELVPDLAEAWTISPDATEFTFNLRKGVQWHKGYGEVTAEDVVWTYTRVRNPDLGSRSTAEFAGVKEVVAEDPYTVRITLETPDPIFAQSVLARVGYIGNQRAIEEKGEGYTSDPVGSGPYIFESWTKGEQLVLVKNPGHWLHEGNVETVTFKFLTDDKVAELSLRSGDLDIAYVETPEAQRAVVDNPDLTSIEEPAARTHNLWLRMKEGTPLADARVRRALAIAIDRELLAEEALDGMAQPAHSVFNPLMPGYVDTEFFAYDPDTAEQLLAEAGFGNGFQLELLGYNEGVSPDIMAVVQDQWREIGIDVTVTILERAILYNRWQAGDFDVIEQPIARDFPEQIIYSHLHSDGIPYPNAGHYSGLDELAADLRPEPDPEVRLRLYRRIQEKLAEDVPVIPTIYPKVVLGMRKSIEPFPIDIWYYPLWRIKVTG